MNSKLNRQIKPKKSGPAPKAEEQSLKSQANKIQSKLESLKAELAMRKTMKNSQQLPEQQQSLKTTQKSSTGESWNTNIKSALKPMNQKISSDKINKFLLSNSKSSTNRENNEQNDEDKRQLQSLLEQLKMQEFKDTVMNVYGISGLSKMLELSQEDIDGWKAVPVGFRIKLRKIINEHNKNKEDSSPEKCQKINNDAEDIQAIIKRRQTQRIYQPINDKEVEEDEAEQGYGYNQDITEEIHAKQKQRYKDQQQQQQDEQDILISSLNSAFLQRRGIMKKQRSISDCSNRSQNKQKVQWDKNVKQYCKQTSNFKGEKLMTRYPTNVQSTLEHTQQIKYCWNCLKKLNKQRNQHIQQLSQDNRSFCSEKCKQVYQQMTMLTKMQEDNNINSKVEKVPHQSTTNQYQQEIEYEDDELDLSLS